MEKTIKFHLEMTEYENDRLKKLAQKMSVSLGMKVSKTAAVKVILHRAFKKEGV